MSPTSFTLHSVLTLIVLAGAAAVVVENVGLHGDSLYSSVQAAGPTVFSCQYRLQPGETLDEVVWVRGGRLVDSYRPPADNSPAEAEMSRTSTFELPSVTRSSAGIYSCTARTKAGDASTGKFELFVTDIPDREFSFSTSTRKCVYNFSLETPAAYPTMTAFCGVWVNKTSSTGQHGYWMVPPPDRTETNEVSYDVEEAAGALQTQPKLSYSTELGDFSKIFYDEDRIGFHLKDATIRVDDTPEDSYIKCFTGFYKKSGAFLKSNSMTSNTESHGEVKCSNRTLQQFTTQHASLTCSNCEDACRGHIKPLISSLPLTATLHCSKTLQSRTLHCRQSRWMLDVGGGAFNGAFQDELLDFAENCEKAEVVPEPEEDEDEDDEDDKDDGDDDSGSGRLHAEVITLLLASFFISLLLRPAL